MANEAKVAAKESPHIYVWVRDPKAGFVRRTTILAVRIAGVLSLESPLCLVIAADGGRGMLLDLEKEKLSIALLQVTPLPPAPLPPVDPKLPTSEQTETLVDLVKRVPAHDRFAIQKEASKKTDQTPRQRVEWLIEQYRQYIETKKPAPFVFGGPEDVDPDQPTPEQLRTQVTLYGQLPQAEANAINAAASKETDLTPRQRIEWLIEQYRQYLERHKPTPEEKKQSNEETGAEESPGRKPAGSDE